MNRYEIPACLAGELSARQVTQGYEWGNVTADFDAGQSVYTIVVAMKGERIQTVFEYDNGKEWLSHLERLIRFGDDGNSGDNEAGAGVPRVPRTPSRSDSAALELPIEQTSNEDGLSFFTTLLR